MSGFLSDLSTEQQAALIVLKESLFDVIASTLGEEALETTTLFNVPLAEASVRRDVVLLKFLRARDFNSKKAAEMVGNCLRWRKEYGIDGILDESFPDEFEQLGFYDGKDKDGRPIMVNSYGRLTSGQMFQSGMDAFIRWRVQFMERGIRDHLDMETHEDFLQVHDYAGVGLSNFNMQTKSAAKKTIHLLQDYYPEFLHKKFFINVPSFFSMAFNFFKFLITERTRRKFYVCSSDFRATMSEFVHDEDLPEIYRDSSNR